jgi:hypothetical protein
MMALLSKFYSVFNIGICYMLNFVYSTIITKCYIKVSPSNSDEIFQELWPFKEL